MRLGLIARGEDRGLGHLTYDFYRGFGADRVLLVDMGELARGFPIHADRYPNATRVQYAVTGHLPEGTVRDWIDGCDVIYSAETFYDWRIIEWARAAGVRTVCHLMPEFWRHGHEELPTPDAWWTPTAWRVEHLPRSTTIMPIPVPVECPGPGPMIEGRRRFVHVAGHRAAQDRAGTVAVMRALHLLTEPCSVRIVTQDQRLPSVGRLPAYVDVETVMGGVSDRWDLYRGADALVSPRRYGGLSLPVNEALGMGLGVLMSDCPPNAEQWPISPIKVESRTPIRTGAGIIDTYEPTPFAVAAAIDECAADPGFRTRARGAAEMWARLHSWDVLGARYAEGFRRVLDAG